MSRGTPRTVSLAEEGGGGGVSVGTPRTAEYSYFHWSLYVINLLGI